MPNLMTNIYIGYVEEIIYKDGVPTLELRIRIPTIHGEKPSTGLKKSELPIAKPLVTPGVSFNSEQLIEELKETNKVYVLFESGDHEQPVYFGVKGNTSLYKIPSFASSLARQNLTFSQDSDPEIDNEIIEGDIWFDTFIEE